MLGTHHRQRAGARAAFVPLSVFALLALACLPGLALADSSGVQYQDAAPIVPDKSDPSAGSSGAGGVNAGGQSSTESGSGSSGGIATDGSSSGGDDDKSGGAAGKGDGGNGQGSQGGGAAGETGVGGARALDTADKAAIAHDSGSSPLVPILIALAVLAAISIGIVTMRRRGQGGKPGSGAKSRRVSPEAG